MGEKIKLTSERRVTQKGVRVRTGPTDQKERNSRQGETRQIASPVKTSRERIVGPGRFLRLVK